MRDFAMTFFFRHNDSETVVQDSATQETSSSASNFVLFIRILRQVNIEALEVVCRHPEVGSINKQVRYISCQFSSGASFQQLDPRRYSNPSIYFLEEKSRPRASRHTMTRYMQASFSARWQQRIFLGYKHESIDQFRSHEVCVTLPGVFPSTEGKVILSYRSQLDPRIFTFPILRVRKSERIECICILVYRMIVMDGSSGNHKTSAFGYEGSVRQDQILHGFPLYTR